VLRDICCIIVSEKPAIMFSTMNVFQLIATHTTDLVCLHDADNTIRFATPSSKQILGRISDTLVGSKLTDFLSEEFINEMDFTTLMRFFDQPGTRIRYQIKHGEGRLRWLETTFTELESAGNVDYRSLSTTRDITESVHLTEDLMNALSKEQELSKFKTNLYSVASHEFKTPLAIIQANIEMLKVKKTPKLLDLGLITMEEEVDRLNSMIMDMLELKKLTTGRRTFHLSQVDFVQIAEELFNEYSDSTGNYNRSKLEVIGTPKELQADYSLIRYIFRNLLGNALKFSDVKDPVEIIIDFSQDNLEVSFIDKGIGVPEEDQVKIFQSFYRASNVSNIPGTGVGLSIVSEFIKLHKGNIKLVSEEGKGSTFIFCLPKL
jgi:PAS domain S-box-containing protein